MTTKDEKDAKRKVAAKPRKPRAPRLAKAKLVTAKPTQTVAPVRSTPIKTPRTVKRSYLFAVGRRKSAIARVRLTAGAPESIIINDKKLPDYFPQAELQIIVQQPLEAIARSVTGTISIQTHGGGKRGQAEAIRLGIARTLVLAQADLRAPIKHAGYLTRDPRVKERKKYGLKRARRAPQWQKR